MHEQEEVSVARVQMRWRIDQFGVYAGKYRPLTLNAEGADLVEVIAV